MRRLNLEIPLKFLFMGDWGSLEAIQSKGTSKQENYSDSNKESKSKDDSNNAKFSYWNEKVSYAMSIYATLNKPEFLISLGDNFYNNGVSSVTDSLWKTLYTNVYNYDSLQIPWYAILGNHDYGTSKTVGNPQAQIDYASQKIDNRWNMDSHCYTKIWELPGSRSTLQVVFIDTNLLAPDEAYVTSIEHISRDEQNTRKNTQLRCIEEHLSTSTATWLLVAGHYPLYSSGLNTPGDMTSMITILEDILIKYKVDMYLSAHDHILQHLSKNSSSGEHKIDYFISGCGSKTDKGLYLLDNQQSLSLAESQFVKATAGFAVADVTANLMTVRFIDSDNNVLYSTSRLPSRLKTVNNHNSTSTSSTRLHHMSEGSSSSVLSGTTAEHHVLAMKFLLAAGVISIFILVAVQMGYSYFYNRANNNSKNNKKSTKTDSKKRVKRVSSHISSSDSIKNSNNNATSISTTTANISTTAKHGASKVISYMPYMDTSISSSSSSVLLASSSSHSSHSLLSV
eukprot:gene12281-25829_t